MLLHVRVTDASLAEQTFQMIFTSPSSARGNLDAEPVPESRRKCRKGLSKRPPIATKLRMDGQVTACAIAYAAVQVCRSLHCSSCLTLLFQLHYALCDATHWMSHYNGFNYEEFYEFIIDFFEADQTQEGKNISRELYDWWNKYIFDSASTFANANTFPDRCSRGPLLPEPPHLSQCGSRRLRSDRNNVEPAYLAYPPSSFMVVFARIYLINANITICETP